MKKMLMLSLIPILLFSACSNKKESTNPTEPGDGYVDVLPSSNEGAAILHAFDWKYNQIKDNLPAIKDAGYKVVQTSPVAQPKSGGANWMMFYQPVSFSIAQNSPLGTKQELKELCDAAEALGIDIICDMVFNHMGTNGEEDSQGLPVVDKEVELYEPYIYQHQDECFHHYTASMLTHAVGATTMIYPGLPDLNTANPYVQERALSLLKECIDIGVDGFRFDAAKHIERSTDPAYASNFWENTLGVAKEYYKQKNNGKELLAYGEILNDADGGRQISSYTDMMKVTDNGYTDVLYSAFSSQKSERFIIDFTKDTNPNNIVVWAESHDTYVSGHPVGERSLARLWAVLSARKGSSTLFFARPDENTTVAKVGDYNFESEYVAVSNRFHNRFLGADEDQHTSDDFYVNERFSSNDCGALVFDCKKATKGKVTFNHLEDGYYFDQMTNKQYRVKGGKATIEFHDYGYALLTKTNNPLRPTYTVSKRDMTYANAFNVKLTVKNATSASYQVDNGEFVSFENETTIRIGENATGGQTTTLTFKASNGVNEIQRKWTYKKVDLIDGYFNVVNLDEKYLTDYSLYIWKWSPSSYVSTFTWNAENKILLIENSLVSEWTGFLLVVFEKDYSPSPKTQWDSSLIKQSADINIDDGFFDATGF